MLVGLCYVTGSVERAELDMDGRRHAEYLDRELLEGREEGGVIFEALRLVVHVHQRQIMVDFDVGRALPFDCVGPKVAEHRARLAVVLHETVGVIGEDGPLEVPRLLLEREQQRM